MRIIPLFFAVAISAAAQWIDYPTPGIPRSPDGKPNFKAPAPRTADGKPDLSGIWESEDSPAVPPGIVIVQDAGFNLQNWRPEAAAIPMSPWAEAVFKERNRTFGVDRPSSHCLPHSVPDAMIPSSFKIVQNPGLTLILYEEFTRFRQIFTDGRGYPKEMNPAWYGYSIGKWEGDAFVVDTAGFNDRSWLDDAGHPHSDQLHTVERFRRPNFGHLQVEVTIEDPKAYTQPWSVTLGFHLLADTELIEDVCDNEQDRGHLLGRIPSDDKKLGIDVTPDVLSTYVGAYEFKMPGADSPQTHYVSLNGGLLIFDGIQLTAHSQTEFCAITGDVANVQFFKDATGDVSRMAVDFSDGAIEGVRKK